MSSTQSINQYLANIDYGWTKPASLVLFVPGLSLYTLNQQITSLFKTINDKYKTSHDYFNLIRSKEYAKIATVYKAHVLGSLVQAVACIAAVKLTGIAVFSVPVVFALYEFGRCVLKLGHESATLDKKKLVIKP